MEIQLKETEKLIEERKKVDDIRIRYRQKKHQLEEKERFMLKQQQLNANDCVVSEMNGGINNVTGNDHQEEGPTASPFSPQKQESKIRQSVERSSVNGKLTTGVLNQSSNAQIST